MKNSYLIGVAAAALLASAPVMSLAQQTQQTQPALQQGGGDEMKKKKPEAAKAEEPRQKGQQAEEPKSRAKDGKEQVEEPKLKADKARQAEEAKLKAKDGKGDQAEETKLKAKDGKGEQAEETKLKAKDGKGEQAEEPALRKDRDKAGSTEALRKEEPRAGEDERAGAGDRLGKVQLEEKERMKVRDTFSRQRVERARDANFSISIGATVPRTVRYHPVPVEIVETVPDWRGHSYVVVEDEIVIIEPTTREVVAVLDRGGRARRGSARLVLNDAERDLIRQRGRLAGSCDLTGVDLTVGAAIPRRIKLHAFPKLVIGDVPQLRPYRYCVVEDDLIVIDPEGREIVMLIEG
jgi:hypothetical protein